MATTKKVNTAKLTELINSEVSKSLNEIKDKVKSTKKPTAKKLEEKADKKVEEKKPVAKSTKKVEKSKSETKKEAVTKEVTKINKTNLVEKVVSNREVKYVYPDDVNDTLSRKAWRQKVRNKLDKLERDMFRIKDQNSKEYKAAEKAYNEYRKTVLKEVG